jgi:ubiquinone/menaquinone biosynthesis C-methylase UbiE
MEIKFEATVEFAEEWLEYKKLAVPTQEAILLPSIFNSITKSNPIICDLGCGDGELTCKMQVLKPILLFGLDINNSLLKIARDRAISNFEFNLCDLAQDNFPIPNSYCDILLSSNLLMHIGVNSIEHTLSESYRILKHNGEAFFIVTNFEWALLQYNLIKLSEGTFEATRNIWGSRISEYYRTANKYSEYFKISRFDIIEIVNLIIPNDKRLNQRYLSNIGLPLFTLYKLRKQL